MQDSLEDLEAIEALERENAALQAQKAALEAEKAGYEADKAALELEKAQLEAAKMQVEAPAFAPAPAYAPAPVQAPAPAWVPTPVPTPAYAGGGAPAPVSAPVPPDTFVAPPAPTPVPRPGPPPPPDNPFDYPGTIAAHERLPGKRYVRAPAPRPRYAENPAPIPSPENMRYIELDAGDMKDPMADWVDPPIFPGKEKYSGEKMPYFDEALKIRSDVPLIRMEVTGWLISNEAKNWLWREHIQNMGGIHVGVGAEQNYVLAGWSRPEVLICSDRDSNIQLLHKAYHCTFELASTPDEFVYLWSDPVGLIKLREAAEHIYEGTGMVENILHCINMFHLICGIKLGKLQRQYARLQIPIFLTDQETYDFVRGLWTQGRVIPVGGDIYKDKTMKDISKFARTTGLPINVVYVSNARLNPRERQYSFNVQDNIVTMPMNEKTIFLRTSLLDGERQAPKSTRLGSDTMWIFYLTTGADLRQWVENRMKQPARSWYDGD